MTKENTDQERTLGTRFVRNGFEALYGRPQNENPPNEWYYIEPWYIGKKYMGLVITIAPEAAYAKPNHDLIPVVLLPNGWTTYTVPYVPNLNETAEYLSDLFNHLMYRVGTEPKGGIKQSMVIKTFSSSNSYGICGFDVDINQSVRDWVSNCTEKDLKAVKLSMQKAFNLMFPQWPTDISEFRMWVHDDRFGLSVPGNCACLGVDGTADTDHGLNYTLTPHNNDSFAQQMGLLAGIVHIWDCVRKCK